MRDGRAREKNQRTTTVDDDKMVDDEVGKRKTTRGREEERREETSIVKEWENNRQGIHFGVSQGILLGEREEAREKVTP
jgi:hypothetical protein